MGAVLCPAVNTLYCYIKAMFNRWFYILFAVVIVMGLLHRLGLNYAYYTLWWFDIAPHFLGGFWVAGMALWLAPRVVGGFFLRANVYAVGLIAALFIGTGWEFFEVFIDPLLSEGVGYWEDTVMDLVMDSSGGLAAALLFSHFVSNNS